MKVIMFNGSNCIHDSSNDNDNYNTLLEAEFLCKGDFDNDGKEEIAFFTIDGKFIVIKDNHKYYSSSNSNSSRKHIIAIDTFHNNRVYIIILYMNGTIKILQLDDYDDSNNIVNMKVINEQNNIIINATCMKTFLYKNAILLVVGDRKKIIIYASKIGNNNSNSSNNNSYNFTIIGEENIGTCITSLDYVNDSDFIVVGLITGITIVYQIDSFSYYYVDDASFYSPSQISTRTSTPGFQSLTRSPTPLNITRQATPVLYLPFMPLYQHTTPIQSAADIVGIDGTDDDSILDNVNESEVLSSKSNAAQTSIIHTQPKRIIPFINSSIIESVNSDNALSIEKPQSDSRTSSFKHLQNISHVTLKLIQPSLEDVLEPISNNNKKKNNNNNKFITLPTYVSAGTSVRQSFIASNKELIFASARLDGRVSFCQIVCNDNDNDNDGVVSYTWQTIYAIQIEDSPYKIDFIREEIINPCILYNDNHKNEATSTYCCSVHSRGGRTLFINFDVMTDYSIFKALGKPAPPILLLFDSELLIGEEASRNFCYANNSLYYVTCTGSIYVISGIKEQLRTIGSSRLSTVTFKPETISMITYLLESLSTYNTAAPISDHFENIMKVLPNNAAEILSEAVTKYLLSSSSSTSLNSNMNLAIQYVLDELMKLK